MKTEKMRANKGQTSLTVVVVAILVVSALLAAFVLGRNSSGNTTTQSSLQSSVQSTDAATSTSAMASTSQTYGVTTNITYDPADIECPTSCTLNVYWSSIYQPYQTLGSLGAAADFVVVGNVTSSLTVAVGDVPVTLYNVTVTTFVKGGEEIGTNFVMGEVGGAADNKTMAVNGYPTLAVGAAYVLFVTPAGGLYSSNGTARLPNAPFTNEVGEAGAPYLVYMTQGGPEGLFYVQDGNVYSLDNMYPQADSWLPVKAPGVPLAQFVQEVQESVSSSTTSQTT